MCYSGECPYEYSGGPYELTGGCTLEDGEPMPDDAACVVAMRQLEEWECKHPVRAFIRDVKYRLKNLGHWQDDCPF